MKFIKIVLLSLALFSTASCITYQMIPVESNGNDVRTNRGSQILISEHPEIIIASSAEVTRQRIYLHLLVKNKSDHYITVDDNDVKLLEWNTGSGTQALYVYHAEEYYKKRRTQIITGQVLMIVSAAMSSYNAGTSTYRSNGSFNYSGYGRNGYYSGFGSYTGTTTVYNSAQAAYERDIAFSNAQNYIHGGNAELEYLRNALFYPSEIPPNGEYYGLVVAEMGSTTESQMEYRITIAGEEFILRFNKQTY